MLVFEPGTSPVASHCANHWALTTWLHHCFHCCQHWNWCSIFHHTQLKGKKRKKNILTLTLKFWKIWTKVSCMTIFIVFFKNKDFMISCCLHFFFFLLFLKGCWPTAFIQWIHNTLFLCYVSSQLTWVVKCKIVSKLGF